jgi:hypothetical protein
MAPILGLNNKPEEDCIWNVLHTLVQGIRVPFYCFEISSVSVRDAEGPGDSGLGVFLVGRS